MLTELGITLFKVDSRSLTPIINSLWRNGQIRRPGPMGWRGVEQGWSRNTQEWHR